MSSMNFVNMCGAKLLAISKFNVPEAVAEISKVQMDLCRTFTGPQLNTLSRAILHGCRISSKATKATGSTSRRKTHGGSGQFGLLALDKCSHSLGPTFNHRVGGSSRSPPTFEHQGINAGYLIIFVSVGNNLLRLLTGFAKVKI